MPPKKDEDPIVFEDLHPADEAEDADDDEPEDPFAAFAEGEDPFAMPDVDDEEPETKRRADKDEDEDPADKELIGQEEVEREDEPEDEVDDQPDEVDDQDELAGIKDPALRNRILADRRRLDEQDQQIAQMSRATVAQAQELLKTRRESIDAEITDLKKGVVKAKEDGNSEDEVDGLTKIQAKQIELDKITDQEKQLEASAPEADVAPSQGLKAKSEQAQQWIDRNSWVNDARFKAQREAMGVIDIGLYNEGYDINSQDYFDELDRRLRRKFPDLPGGKKTMKKPAKPAPKKKSAVAAVDRGSVTKRSSRSGRVVLTAEDRANMVRFNLDPQDADQVKAYAAEKAAIEKQEEQTRAR